MKEFVRGVVWHGPELAVQRARRPDGTVIYGFPGAEIPPGERPADIAVAALSRYLQFDFHDVILSERQVIGAGGYNAHFFEGRVPYPSLRPRRIDGKDIRLMGYLEVENLACRNLMADLSAEYIKREFIDGVINN